MNESGHAKTCPYCQSGIKSDAQVETCPECGMPHHHECWLDNGGCTTFGCGSRPAGPTADASGNTPEAQPEPVFPEAPRRPVILSIALVVVLLVCMIGVAWGARLLVAHFVVERQRSELFSTARRHLANDSYLSARQALVELIRISPQSPTAHKLMGDAWKPRFEGSNFDNAVMEYRKALGLNPGYVAAFKELRDCLLTAYSGPGGYFLDDQTLAELEKYAEGIRLETGTVPEEEEFLTAFITNNNFSSPRAAEHAWQLLSLLEGRGLYAGDPEWNQAQQLLEYAEWLSSNRTVSNGRLNIRPYPGDIYRDSTVQLADGDLLWLGWFKGPVVCYDSASDKHFVVYIPPDQYEWPTVFAADPTYLWIGLSVNKVIRFDKLKHRIRTYVLPPGHRYVAELYLMDDKAVINGQYMIAGD